MAKLLDVCKKSSSNITQKDLGSRKGEYPIYGASGFIANVDFYQQEKPYIAIVKDGAGIGRVIKLPAQSSVIGTMQYILPYDNVDITYLAFALEHMNLSKYYTGSTIPHIYFKDYQKEELPLPTINEQKRISRILDKINNLISFRNQQLDKLDELVKSRFIEMFGDVMSNSKGWELYKLNDISTSRLGKMLDAKQQTGICAFPYLANFNVQWFHFNTENLNTMDFNEIDQEKFHLEYGDLLVCEGGEIGRCAVWHNDVQPCFFQKALHRIRCNQKIIRPDYLSWWFKFNCDNGGFENIAGAKATIAHLPGIKLKALQIAVPPIELQNQFVAFVSQVDKSKLAVKSSLEKLEILKKSLMQKYFG